MRIIFLVLLFFNISFSKQVWLDSSLTNNKNNAEVYLINDSLFDIEYEITQKNDDTSILVFKDHRNTLKAKSSKLVSKYKVLNNNPKISTSFKWVIGNKNSVHSDYVYSLPFKEKTMFKVTQGHNTDFTHNNNSLYAIDFGMPIGTPVYSIREGIVVSSITDNIDHKVSGNKGDKGNSITVRHSDGTYSKYSHLQQNKNFVKVGDYIKKNQLIAFSGNSGYSTGPHLHILVFKGKGIGTRESIKIKFQTLRSGVVEDFKTNDWYYSCWNNCKN